MNYNHGSTVLDIRQSNPCQECGHVAETVPFEGKELCDGCLRPMTLERIKASLAMEEVTAVCVHKQYEFKEWYGPAIAFVDELIKAESLCPDCGGELEDGECEWCDHEECRDGGHLCEDCLGTAIDDAMDRMEAYQ